MIVYLDSDFKCHTAQNGADREIAAETDAFDGFAPEVVAGYRFVPAGETWTREDGVEFVGEMISPWKDYAQLDAAQRDYEQLKVLTAEGLPTTLTKWAALGAKLIKILAEAVIE